MSRKYLYLLSLLLVFVIPSAIAASFVLPVISINQLAIFVVTITIVGSLWDLWATRHGRRDPIWIWTFNHRDTLGIRFLGLPIEEYLFYVFSSVYIVFLWKSIEIASDQNNAVYWLIPGLCVWTLLSLLIPYRLRPRSDKLIG